MLNSHLGRLGSGFMAGLEIWPNHFKNYAWTKLKRIKREKWENEMKILMLEKKDTDRKKNPLIYCIVVFVMVQIK